MAKKPFLYGTSPIFHQDFSSLNAFHESPNGGLYDDLQLQNFATFKSSNGLVFFGRINFYKPIRAPLTLETSRFITRILMAFNSLILNSIPPI